MWESCGAGELWCGGFKEYQGCNGYQTPISLSFDFFRFCVFTAAKLFAAVGDRQSIKLKK